MDKNPTLDQVIENPEQFDAEHPEDQLLSFLSTRKTLAKAFGKDNREEIDRCVSDYEAEENTLEGLHKKLSVNRRYEFVIPYIFATHESYLSSIFEKAPDLIITGRGAKDEEKAMKIRAAYEYLWDKLDLDAFVTDSAWWFLLTGMASADIGFKSEFREVPAIDPDTGEPMIDEDGTPIMTIQYEYNDPTIDVDEPKKIYFAPESKYSPDAKKVPYHFREALMYKEDVEDIYGRKVNATDELEVEDLKDDIKKYQDELDRVKVFKYNGAIPKKHEELVNEVLAKKAQEAGEEPEVWELNAPFYICFTSSAVLHIEKRDRKNKNLRLVRWHGRPDKFFGFGLGKTLRQFQKELSIRRGQQIRYADVAAYAKIALEESSTTDPKSLLDPRENVVITYTEKPPSYLTPPDLSNTLILTEQKAREDAQFVSGMLDMSKGAQDSNTVDTATGQMMFAQSAEKRVVKARKELGKYLREVVIQLLKLCALNWDEAKLQTITDDDGNDHDIEITAEDLQDIDFDTDVNIDLETITVNKEIMREQVIALYDKTKDDPLVERRKVFKLMLREGFNVKDPDLYIKESELQPGMTLIEPASGQQFQVGEDGELMPIQAQQELAEPSAEGGDQPASTMQGLANSVTP